MSQLILPARFNKQPQSTPEIDWGSPQAKGLVMALPFVDSFHDVAGNSIGTAYNSPTFETYQGRRALRLNGTNQYVALQYPYSRPTLSGEFSISLWVNQLVINGSEFFNTRQPNDYSIDFGMDSGGAGFSIDIGNGSSWIKTGIISSSTNIVANKWLQTIVSVTQTGLNVYLNGALINAVNWTSNTPLCWDGNHQIYIGQVSNLNWLTGYISDVRVYDRALSATDAQQFYVNPWQIFRKSRRLFFVGGAAVARSIAEALSASDSSSITIIRFATQTEAATAADNPSQTNSVSRATSETATATDSTSQGQVLAASTTETATATDSASALRQILAAVDEAASAAQTAAATALTTAAATETATATDATTSAQAGVSSVDETATATDSLQATGEVTKSATEAVSATDSPASGNQLQAALTEAAAATDAPSARTLLTAAAQEIASATDTLTALLQQVVAVNEAARAQDLIAQINSLSSAITEAATATDAPITIQTLALVVSWQFYARQAARFFYAAAPFRAFYAKAPARSFYALCQSDMAVPIPYAIDPSETKVITLDATADLSGVTLTGTPTIAVAVTKGSDPNASAHFTSPTINTTPISVTTPSGASVTIATGLAIQFIASGCVDGCSYEIRITCQTSQANNVEVLKASLTCTAS